MPGANIRMLQVVADGFRELKDDVVFIVGAVVELYASDPAAYDIRVTQDVDCVIELSSRVDHIKLEENLRSKGFVNDTSPGAPICRWIYNDIKVDVMPTDSDILGFSNRWYAGGIENKIIKTLPNKTEIFVFSPEYYLASKFEAHKCRGGNDLRQSHDFEDIIYIFENCSTLFDDVCNSNQDVKLYLNIACQVLSGNDDLTEGIESALPYGSGPESIEVIKNLISVCP